MAYNDFRDECGEQIVKIIQEQVELRDEVVWMHGLRGEKPKHLEKIGLKEFYLQHNQLGTKFI